MANDFTRLAGLQGCVSIAERNRLTGGLKTAFRHVGNVSDLQISMKIDRKKKKETCSGAYGLLGTLITGREAGVKIKMDSWVLENLAMAVSGIGTSVVSGTVTGEQILEGTAFIGGDAAFKYPNVSAVVIKDSLGTTLVNGTDYKLFPIRGKIEFLNVTGFTAPFAADYAYADSENVSFFTDPSREWVIRFEGVNTFEGNAPITVELYRVQLDPSKSIDLIKDDFAMFELDGDLLVDTSKPEGDAIWGQYARIIQTVLV